MTDEMRDVLRGQWHKFIDDTQHMRPQLHRYARRLTANVWDAEDLLQDALLRAFGSLATVDDPIDNLQAYINRILTNLWIDQVRSRGVIEYRAEEVGYEENESADTARLVVLADASRELLRALPPKQMAAILLKDVFGDSLEDTAASLQTTVGAVKSLLSRGRKNLTHYVVSPKSAPLPSKALVDRFVVLFNAGDQQGLLKLLLDNAVAGNVGTDTEWGYTAHRSKTSWLNGSLGGHPEWPAKYQFESQRAESVLYQGEPLILHFRTRAGREALEGVVRLQQEDELISELSSYSFCPELVQHIAEYFQVPVRTGPYRYPTPARAERYMDQVDK